MVLQHGMELKSLSIKIKRISKFFLNKSLRKHYFFQKKKFFFLHFKTHNLFSIVLYY